MLEWVLIFVVSGFGVVLVVLTALPLIPTSEKWIRIWDFPRVQIAAFLILAFAATLWFLPNNEPGTLALLAGLAASFLWQVFRIWPYTPLHPRQVKDAPDCEAQDRLRLLTSNVLMDNRNPERLIEVIREFQPDIALLVETDTRWADALAPLVRDYAAVIRHPQGNTYGMMLLSRLELIDPEIRFLLDEGVPSVKTSVRLRSGDVVTFYGLHPKPPPLAHTAKRDAELITVASEIRQERRAVIVAGDLNDVAWSRTTTLFQKMSGLLDPRVGRGFFQTFHAQHVLARWPLDHVFFDRSFRLSALRVLPDVGSDHFPLYVELCHQPERKHAHEKPRADASDLKQAREVIDKGNDAARNRS